MNQIQPGAVVRIAGKMYNGLVEVTADNPLMYDFACVALESRLPIIEAGDRIYVNRDHIVVDPFTGKVVSS